MRNILKPAARTASSRTRRSLRGVAAVVASVALAAGLGSYPVDAQETSAEPTASATAETATATTTTTETPSSSRASSAAPKPVVVEPNSVTVERDGDVDHITIRDTDDNPWDSGRKASDEYIWGVKRTGDGDITRIVKVVADGEELDPQYFGYVNGEDYDVIGIDEDAFWTIPPMKLEIEVETTDAGEYVIAEPDEVPTARELSETGYGRTDQAAATVNPEGVGMARAAAPGNIPGVPGEQDQELSSKLNSTTWVNSNPELRVHIDEDGDWRLTRFAIKKVKVNDSNTKDITGPVRIRVIRNNTTVADRTISDLTERSWKQNRLGRSWDTEFQLIPRITDFEFKGGDTLVFNPVGPPNDDYAVQVWGQAIDSPGGAWFEMKSEGGQDAIPLSTSTTSGDNPYRTTAVVEADSRFKEAVVEVRAPNSFLATEHYSFHIDLLEEGVQFKKEVIETGSEFVKMRVYPVRNGKPVEDGVLIPKGARITSTASFNDDPKQINGVTTISGSIVRKETQPRLETLPDSGDWLPQRVPNPEIPQKCGLKIAIVADLSRSLKYADRDPSKNSGEIGFAESRKAATTLVESLQGTSTRVGIYNFARTRGTTAGTTGDAVSMMTESGVSAAKTAIGQWTQENTPGDATNWEDGLSQLHGKHYDLVYFITDGVPTWDNQGWQNPGMDNTGAFLQKTSARRAVEAANQLKLEGTRIVPIMVSLTLGADRDGRNLSPNYVFTQDYVLKDMLPWNSGVATTNLKDKIVFQRTKVAAQDKRSALYNTKDENIIVNFERAVELGYYKVFRIDSRGNSKDITSDKAQWAYGPRTVDQLGKDISSDDAPVKLEDYYQLAGQLQSRAAAIKRLCEGELVVKKRLVDPNGELVENGDGAPGWTFSAAADQTVLDPGNGSPVREDSKSTAETDRKFNNSDPTTSVKKGTVKWRLTPTNTTTGDMEETQLTVAETIDPESGYEIFKRDLKNAVCTQIVGGKTYGAEVVNRGENGFEVIAAPYARVFCTVDNTKTEIVEPETFALTLTKVDAQDKAVGLSGAEFTLSWAEEDGTATSVALTEEAGATGRYLSEKILVPGQTYVLAETKSPKSEDGAQYALLTQPVTLRFVPSEAGVVPEFRTNTGTWVSDSPPLPILEASFDQDTANVALTLANVRQGNMPKTGGVGVQLPILFGGALIAAGALMGRRKVAA